MIFLYDKIHALQSRKHSSVNSCSRLYAMMQNRILMIVVGMTSYKHQALILLSKRSLNHRNLFLHISFGLGASRYMHCNERVLGKIIKGKAK